MRLFGWFRRSERNEELLYRNKELIEMLAMASQNEINRSRRTAELEKELFQLREVAENAAHDINAAEMRSTLKVEALEIALTRMLRCFPEPVGFKDRDDESQQMMAISRAKALMAERRNRGDVSGSSQLLPGAGK